MLLRGMSKYDHFVPPCETVFRSSKQGLISLLDYSALSNKAEGRVYRPQKALIEVSWLTPGQGLLEPYLVCSLG